MPSLTIRPDPITDPRVIALLQAHRAAMFEHSPPDSVHALDLDGLRRSGIRLYTAWEGEQLLACGALKELPGEDPPSGELKSMRTSAQHLRRGAATAVLRHLLDEARASGWRRLYLETGTVPAFDAARALYARHGFVECGPFADYRLDPYSVFMVLEW